LYARTHHCHSCDLVARMETPAGLDHRLLEGTLVSSQLSAGSRHKFLGYLCTCCPIEPCPPCSFP
jgi:hypothetical protein